VTGRPADWSPLADADPVPGDPYELAMNGRRFRETAREIEGTCKRLRSMCTDSVWDSDAGRAFRAHADDTAGKLAKAAARYEAAATALGTGPGDSSPPTASRPNYAGALGHAQEVSLKARSLGQDAESR
jgi:hypothetical protein